MDKKKYVLDTSVLVADPDALYKFDEHEVIIPIVVIQELDGLKKGSNDAAKNARVVSRRISELCDKYKDLTNPIVINDKNGILRIVIDYKYKQTSNTYSWNKDLQLDYSINDNKIINTAYINDAILVSKDNNLRIIAIAHGVKAEDYKHEKVDVSDLYTGIATIEVSEKDIDEIYTNEYIEVGDVENILPNQCLILKANKQSSALGIYDAKNNNIRLVPKVQKYYEIQPKNTEQKFLLDLLFDPDIKLLTVTGTAGSGKSLLTTIAGLYQVMEQQEYKKVIVTRSPMAIESDVKLGFLPGSLTEKLMPWMGAMMDSIDYTMGRIKTTDKKKGKSRGKNKDLDDEKDVGITNGAIELMEHGYLEMLSIEHVRGRSIRNSFIIIEEAQNCSHHTIKTLLTRAGDGSKIILLGDIKQVDAPYLDSSNNGLVNVINKFKGQDIYTHINLVRSERSKLAELADKLL